MKKTADSYRLFIYVFVIFFFIYPLTLGIFNYCVDPNHRYHFSLSEPILVAFSHSKSQLLEVPKNYDDRAFLKKYIPVVAPPSTVVIGGSRVANLESRLFRQSQGAFFNASVVAGTLRDYVALWQIMKKNHWKPKIVLIGIEEQSLNSQSLNNRYLSIVEYYEAFFATSLSLRTQWMGLASNAKDLLSLATTKASLHDYIFKDSSKLRLIPIAQYEGFSPARSREMTLIYPKSYELKAQEVLDREGRQNGEGEIKAFERWSLKDQAAFSQLRALIQDIQKEGGVPVLVGMPYHPEALRMILDDSLAESRLKAMVAELREMAIDQHLFFYDAILLHANDFRSMDFIDGVHLKAMANNRLFKNVCVAAKLDIIDANV